MASDVEQSDGACDVRPSPTSAVNAVIDLSSDCYDVG